MAATYVTVALLNPQAKAAFVQQLIILLQHIDATTASGNGLYTMELVSVVFNGLLNIYTIVLSDPLPAGQVARYGLTLSL